MRSLWQVAQYCLIVARCGSDARGTDADCALMDTTPSETRSATTDLSLGIWRQVSPQALESAAHELVGISHLLVEFLRRLRRDGFRGPAASVQQLRQPVVNRRV